MSSYHSLDGGGGGGALFLGAAFPVSTSGLGTSAFGASATLGGSTLGASTGGAVSGGFGASTGFTSATLGGSTFAGDGIGTGTGVTATFVSGILVAAMDLLRSSSRCMSRICFSRSATRDCDSLSALSFAVTFSCNAFTRSCDPAPPLPEAPLPESVRESLRTSVPAVEGGGGGVTAADATRPDAAFEESGRDGSEATPPANVSR